MNPLELILVLILISTSAFLSSSEIALFSLSRFQIRAMKDRYRASHRKVKALLSDPAGILVTILAINELVNVSISTLVTESLVNTPDLTQLVAAITPWIPLPEWSIQTFLSTLITAPIVLLACEITPKIIGARANLAVISITISPLFFVYRASAPLRLLLKSFLRLIHGPQRNTPVREGGGEHSHPGDKLKEEEFITLVEEGLKEGAIAQDELEMIKNVFDLDDTVASSISTPLNQVITILESMPIKTALQTLKDKQYSRIPIVSQKNKAQVVGVLYTKDLLLTRLDGTDPNDPVSTLMRRPFAIPAQTQLNILFRKMKKTRTHMAILEGPNRETVGILTMADLIEALFEDVLGEEATVGGPT